MKKIIISIFLSIANHLISDAQILPGMLNDVSLNESRILFTCKLDSEDIYSESNLYVFDLESKKQMEVAKIKNGDGRIKSYFITNETILVAADQEVYVYSLKLKTITKSILKLSDNEAILSCRKILSSFYITILNFNDSKIYLVKVEGMEFTSNIIKSYVVKILPTDNFFDIFIINNHFWKMENGLLTNDIDSNVFNLLFNDEMGNYNIYFNKTSLCFAVNSQNSRKIFFVSEYNNFSPVSIFNNINFSQLSVESVDYYNREMFQISIDKTIYLIDENGKYIKSTSAGIFFNEKLKIIPVETNKFEIIKTN